MPKSQQSRSQLKSAGLAWQLLQEFRRVPDPYKPDAINQVRLIARLTKRPAVNIIGDEEGDHDPNHHLPS